MRDLSSEYFGREAGGAHILGPCEVMGALPGTRGDPVSGRAPKTKLLGTQASSLNVVSISDFQYIAQLHYLQTVACEYPDSGYSEDTKATVLLLHFEAEYLEHE